MDFRVEIADPAIDDLAEIVSYIAQDNPEAASTLGNHLLDAALSLAQTPRKGSPSYFPSDRAAIAPQWVRSKPIIDRHAWTLT